MKKFFVVFLVLIHLIIAGIATDGEIKPPLYIFSHTDVGTVANYIMLNGAERGIKFHDTSDERALKALQCLKPSIFIPNSDKETRNIVLEGILHPEVLKTPEARNKLESEEYQYFTLEKWYMLAPFVENTYYLEDQLLDGRPAIITHTSLKRTDFNCKTGIDLEGMLLKKEGP